MEEKGERAVLELTINEDGIVVKAQENEADLEYGEKEIKEGKKMDDGTASINRNPCRWKKIGGKWYCI